MGGRNHKRKAPPAYHATTSVGNPQPQNRQSQTTWRTRLPDRRRAVPEPEIEDSKWKAEAAKAYDKAEKIRSQLDMAKMECKLADQREKNADEKIKSLEAENAELKAKLAETEKALRKTLGVSD